MLKIGEFSKLSRVSVRMLRHYDEIGLLKPAEIDRFTDYRYYREDQLPTMCRITALKDMGFSLADIVKILEIYDDREALEGYFSTRQRELEELSRDTARKLALLDAARERLRKEQTMSYDITLKTIPERYAATVQMTIPRYEDEGMVWSALVGETCRMHLTEADPCLCAVTFLDGNGRRGPRLEDRKGKLPRHGAYQIPHAAGGHRCELHLPRQLRADHRRVRRHDPVDRGERL